MRFDIVNFVCFSLAIINLHLVYSKSKPEDDELFLGKYKIPENTPDPINIDIKNVHERTFPPLRIVEIVNKISVLSNTGKSVVATLPQPFTLDSITGGVLGHDKYVFINVDYCWANNWNESAGYSIEGEGFPVYLRVNFRNLKYPTNEIAGKYRDGFTVLVYVLRICKRPFLPFVPFEIFVHLLKNPGTSIPLPIAVLIIGAGIVYPDNVYYAYPGSYIDLETGKQYSSATVIFFEPTLPSCITTRQFESSFGSLKASDGTKLVHSLPQQSNDRPVIKTRGVTQIKTLGV